MANSDADISFGDGVPEMKLQREYGSVVVVPDQLPELGFRLALPRRWKQIKASESAAFEIDRFCMLAAFAESTDVGVQVLGTLLPWEVNLVDWLEYQAYRFGMEMGPVQSGETEYGQTVHAIARGADGAILRILVTGDAQRLIMLLGRMPANADDAVEETLGLAAASFQFVSHSGVRTRERLAVYRDEDALFQLLYPESWESEPLDRLRPAKAGADFRIIGTNDTIAYLRVEADTRQPLDENGLADVYETTLEELAESGIEIVGLTPLPQGVGGGERQRWQGECVLPSGKGQLALLFRPTGKAWLAGVLVCPLKDADPYTWMRDKRAYEIAVASLGPGGTP